MPNENIKLIELRKRTPEEAANYWKQLSINYLRDIHTLLKAMEEIDKLVQKGKYYRVKSTIKKAIDEIDKQ